jgi:hypothetical protein
MPGKALVSIDPPNDWAVEGLLYLPEEEVSNTGYVLLHEPEFEEDWTGREIIMPKWAGKEFWFHELRCHTVSETNFLGYFLKDMEDVAKDWFDRLVLMPDLLMYRPYKRSSIRRGLIEAVQLERPNYFTPHFGQVSHIGDNCELEVGDLIIVPQREFGTPFRGHYICPEAEVLAAIDEDPIAQGASK